MLKKARPRRIPPALLQRSRDMRHPLTPAEMEVWQAVRAHRLGVHIRRQHVLVGRLIPDFYCAAAHLCIEIDGDAHVEPGQAECDAARTALLEERGYRVIRFCNAEVTESLTAVLEAIREACQEAQASPK